MTSSDKSERCETYYYNASTLDVVHDAGTGGARKDKEPFPEPEHDVRASLHNTDVSVFNTYFAYICFLLSCG